MRADVAVVGLGAIGSATLFHLARRGADVIGVDRFLPPHAHGSSHGGTRIYRQAYFEDPAYVPLALRALQLWRELERDADARLFLQTGALTVGPPDGELFSGALRSAELHGIPHEALTAAEATRRFPAYRAPEGSAVLFEPTGGVLFPEACVAAHLARAQALGARTVLGSRVVRVDSQGKLGARIETDTVTIDARCVVIATGAWGPKLAGIAPSFTITRERMHWFDPASPHAAGPGCPVALFDRGSEPAFYAVPDFGSGFKAALHRAGPVVDPDAAPDANEEDKTVSQLARVLAPGGAGVWRESVACCYTNTRDGHFAIGALPGRESLVLASACSGHGFKFASALGEALARLSRGEDAGLPSGLFSPGRVA